MSVSDTPIDFAFTRSISTCNCGAFVWKLASILASSGVCIALDIISLCTFVIASNPSSARSSICNLKPPVAPSPGTGGGGKMPINPSGMWLNLCISFPAIALAESEGSSRSSKGFSMANISAEFGTFTGPLTDRPGKTTTLSTPGSASAIADICFTTASVRSNDAPLGSWAMPTR